MPTWTIYCHIHTESGRRYIGLTAQTMEKRWKNHCFAARKSKSGRWHFPNAIRKYGKDAFTHQILQSNIPTIEQANKAEEFAIELLCTRDPEFGFNLAKGGCHTPHSTRKNPWDRPEFRAKQLLNLPKLIAAGNTPQAKAASKAALSTPEARKRSSDNTIRQFSDPTARQKVSQAVRELHKIPEMAEKFASGLKKSDALRASKTHCINGHEFTIENTKVDENGWRYCKKCSSDRVCEKTYNNKTHCKKGHEYTTENVKFRINSRQRICLQCIKTHCKRGHEFTTENTYHNSGRRICRMCNTARHIAKDKVSGLLSRVNS